MGETRCEPNTQGLREKQLKQVKKGSPIYSRESKNGKNKDASKEADEGSDSFVTKDVAKKKRRRKWRGD